MGEFISAYTHRLQLTVVTTHISATDLRPADLLILYFLLVYGQGTARHIASVIDRKRTYVANRFTELTDMGLIVRVHNRNGPVTVTEAGRELIASCRDTHLLPDQREKIDGALPYSVAWQ